MSIDTSTKIRPFSSIKKRNAFIDMFFVELKYNSKKPKYNYHSGLVAGMLVNDLAIIKPILEAGSIEKDLLKTMLQRLIPKAKGLVEDYNWKCSDLDNLLEQFFK